MLQTKGQINRLCMTPVSSEIKAKWPFYSFGWGPVDNHVLNFTVHRARTYLISAGLETHRGTCQYLGSHSSIAFQIWPRVNELKPKWVLQAESECNPATAQAITFLHLYIIWFFVGATSCLRGWCCRSRSPLWTRRLQAVCVPWQRRKVLLSCPWVAPQGPETQTGKLTLGSAEQELFCGHLSTLRVEGYWKRPGPHVILSTTPSDIIVDAWIPQAISHFFLSIPFLNPEKLNTLMRRIWPCPIPSSDQTVLAPEP